MVGLEALLGVEGAAVCYETIPCEGMGEGEDYGLAEERAFWEEAGEKVKERCSWAKYKRERRGSQEMLVRACYRVD